MSALKWGLEKGGNPMFAYWNSYLFVVFFLILGVLLPISSLWGVGLLLRPHRPTREKLTTYESGVPPVGDAHVRYQARYYLFALLFVVFDVETLFLYPWAVSFRKLGLFGLFEMMLFIVLLGIGLMYAWRKKVLEWN
jgi:NADH-quinone oxidoreductase subunit A